jgi:hypothetical protein
VDIGDTGYSVGVDDRYTIVVVGVVVGVVGVGDDTNDDADDDEEEDDDERVRRLGCEESEITYNH